MRPILRIGLYIMLIISIAFEACKKELSCENCGNDNKPPIADAGPDQTILLPMDSVLLDGSASRDPDGTISNFLWIKIAGPASANIISPAVSGTVVKNLAAGMYQFALKVTDDKGLSAKDTVRITVDSAGIMNHPPIANAGPDQTIVLPVNSATLDGTGSFDPDNNISSYAWTKISGPLPFTITMASNTQTLVTNLAQGIYQFELKVTDNYGLSSRDTTSVTVDPANSNALECNFRMETIAHLPTPGPVLYAVSVGSKILFTRSAGNGVVDLYDTLTHTWETVTGMYATSNYAADQCHYKTAKVGTRIIFSVAANELDSALGQLVNIYDAGSNSWSIVHLSQARSFYAMAVVGNKVFYAGGNTESKKMDVYDATTNSWSIQNFDNARNGMVAESLVKQD